jgi:hypothetical protein
MRNVNKLLGLLAGCLMLQSAACATSDSVAIKPELGNPPAAVTRTCPDPGVTAIENVDQAIDNLTAARLWAVCWKSRAEGWNAFWTSVRAGLRG